MGCTRKWYLDYLRIGAILAVVLMHCSGLIDDEVNQSSVLWHLSILFGSITRWAVPIFVMISGSLMLSKKDLSIKRLFLKYILRFVIAYLFWSFVYTIIFSIIPYYDILSVNGIKNLIAGTLKGGFFHLWFMPMIIGLYVITPILQGCIRGLHEKIIWYWMGIDFVLCFIVPLLRQNAFFENIFGETIDLFNNGFFGEYLFYFILGYLLSRSELNKRWQEVLYIVGSFSAAFTILSVWIPSLYTGSLFDTLRQNNTPNVLLMSAALFVFAKERIRQDIEPKHKTAILFLSKYSFGVYFVHEMILLSMHDFIISNVPPVFAIVVLFLITTLLSYLIVMIIDRIKPISKYIL